MPRVRSKVALIWLNPRAYFLLATPTVSIPCPCLGARIFSQDEFSLSSRIVTLFGEYQRGLRRR
jgi:hypothetical protein